MRSRVRRNVNFAMHMKGNAPDSSEKNHAYYVEGCQFFEAGEFARAATAFRHALEYWPEDAAAWMALGNCQDRMKKPERAEECFRRALSFSPPEDQDGILFNLGNSLLDQDRFEDALEAYGQIARGSDIWRKARRNVALIRLRQKN